MYRPNFHWQLCFISFALTVALIFFSWYVWALRTLLAEKDGGLPKIFKKFEPGCFLFNSNTIFPLRQPSAKSLCSLNLTTNWSLPTLKHWKNFASFNQGTNKVFHQNRWQNNQWCIKVTSSRQSLYRLHNDWC